MFGDEGAGGRLDESQVVLLENTPESRES